MKKIGIGLSLCLVALGLASCGSESNKKIDEPTIDSPHEHTFETTWSMDETNHWHKATCEHTTEIKDSAEHTWNKGEITTPYTLTSTGVKTYTCTVCSQTKTEVVYPTDDFYNGNNENITLEGSAYTGSLEQSTKNWLNNYGYISANGGMIDFTKYKDTIAHVKVSNADELIEALSQARVDYSSTITKQLEYSYMIRKNVRKNETNWKRAIEKGLYLKNADGTYTKIPSDTPWVENDPKYTSTMVYYEDSAYPDVLYEQELNKASRVHIIEITGDIDLAYNKISSDIKTKYSNIVEEWDATKAKGMTQTSWLQNNKISRINVERSTNLLIYSQNGSKLTHGGFKVNYDKNIAFRNLEMDELWQWEDTNLKTKAKMGDYDSVGWAYFKIGYSENVLIDHCTFGKSFDGQIDVANPYYSSLGTYQCSPYQGSGKSTVHISFCDFTAGSDDPNGYLVKMMNEIKADYEAGGTNYLYYKALRDAGISHENILYGIAIPQKKAFLLGDSGTDVKYNKELRVSIGNCRFKNIEDRIPKLRTGEAYMYNCLIDNLQYISYRDKLGGAQSALSKVNSSWKCALVSQGIVCGNGGSFYAQNSIFKGINSLLKDNDSEIVNNTKLGITTSGGYKLVNCLYQQNSTTELGTNFTNATPDKLREDLFSWKTSDGNPPFVVDQINLTDMEAFVNSNVGVNSNIKEMFLKASL